MGLTDIQGGKFRIEDSSAIVPLSDNATLAVICSLL